MSLSRLLLRADGSDGGGGVVTPPNPAFASPPAAAAAATPPAPVVPPPNDAKVTLSADMYKHLLNKETEANAAEAERVRLKHEKQQAEIAAATEAGNHKKAIELANQQAEERLATERTARTAAESSKANLEKELLGSKIEHQVFTAFAGRSFLSPEAHAQAQQILASQLEAVRDASGAILVREKATGKPASQFISESLDSKAYAHFQAAGSTGGAGAAGGNVPGPFVDASGKFKPEYLAALQGRATGTMIEGHGSGQSGGHMGL